jgi:hypothetical protein
MNLFCRGKAPRILNLGLDELSGHMSGASPEVQIKMTCVT